MLSPLCSFGHIASYAELIEHWGWDSAIIPFRMNCGLSRRLRTNVYVCAHLSDDESIAARCGARLDCVSALATLGVDLRPAGEAVHLRLTPNDGRSSARRFDEPRPVRAHWSAPRFPAPTVAATRRAAHDGVPLSRVSVPAAEALRQAMRTCLSAGDRAQAVCTLLETGTLSADRLAEVIAATPRRVRVALLSLGLPDEVDDSLARLSSGNSFPS